MSSYPTREEFDALREQLREERRENAALHTAIRDTVDRKHWPEIVTNKRRHEEIAARLMANDPPPAPSPPALPGSNIPVLGALVSAWNQGSIGKIAVSIVGAVVLLIGVGLFWPGTDAVPRGVAWRYADAKLRAMEFDPEPPVQINVENATVAPPDSVRPSPRKQPSR